MDIDPLLLHAGADFVPVQAVTGILRKDERNIGVSVQAFDVFQESLVFGRRKNLLEGFLAQNGIVKRIRNIGRRGIDQAAFFRDNHQEIAQVARKNGIDLLLVQ